MKKPPYGKGEPAKIILLARLFNPFNLVFLHKTCYSLQSLARF